jgi:hypothetical protein
MQAAHKSSKLSTKHFAYINFNSFGTEKTQQRHLEAKRIYEEKNEENVFVATLQWKFQIYVAAMQLKVNQIF